MRDFINGFKFIFVGKKMLSTVPGIKKWVVIPFLINFTIFIAGLFFGTSEISKLVKWATLFLVNSSGIGFLEYLYYPILILFWIVFVVLYIYVSYLLASLVSSPFYSIVAEKVLVHRGVILPQNQSLYQVIKRSLQMLAVSIVRSILLITFGLALFLLSFIPGVNMASSFLAFIILAFDSADYAMETMGMTLSERLSYLRTHIVEFSGRGLFVGLTALVPGLTLFVMPFAVIGSAALMNEQVHHKELL